ncbi:hypothetical protein Tco_0671904 [Tanacetum coccineum]
MNAIIRTAVPQVRIVERTQTLKIRGPIITLGPTSARDPTSDPLWFVPRRELSDSVEREYCWRCNFPSPKRLRDDYGTTGGSVTGEQGVPALPTLPFITSSVTASPLEEGGDRTDSALNLRILKGDSLVRSAAPVMTEAITVATVDTSMAILHACCAKIRSTPHPQFWFFKSSEKTDRYLCFLQGGQVVVLMLKRKWRSLAEEKIFLLEVKDKEIEDLKSQLLKAKEESAEVTQLRAQVFGLEATENSLRGEVASSKDQNVLLGQECNSLKLKVHELEISSADLREKLEMYEGSLKQLEEFQDNLMGPLRTRLAEIDADFTRCCMRFQESFHPHLLNVVAGRRWLLTHGMKLLVVKCLNSNEYMEALGHAFGRAIEKGMQEGLAAGIEHGQAGRCLTDLEAYIPSAEDDFNSAIRDLRDLNFPLLQELSDKKDASTWDIMDLLRLDDAVAETLGMTDLQPDVSQLMVPVHHKQDRVVIGSQALSVALDICRGRVEKMERKSLLSSFLKDVFVSIDDPLSAEALIEPPAEVPSTNVLSTVVIVPPTDPSVSVEDYDNPDSADVVPENATLGSESEGKIDASAGGGLTFSQLDDEARDAVL